jgi:hypothetical protein
MSRRIANFANPPAPVFYVDNVVDAFEGVAIEPGSIPAILPPLPRMHLEYRDMKARQHRAFDVSTVSLDKPVRSNPSLGAALSKAPAGTKQVAFVRPMVQGFATDKIGQAQFAVAFYFGGPALTTAVVGMRGGVCPDDQAAQILADTLPAYNPVALAFVLARSPLTRIFKGLPTGAAARAAQKRGEPFAPYFLFQIDPLVEVLRTEGKLETEGLAAALRACEAHFARPEDAPIVKVFAPKQSSAARS